MMHTILGAGGSIGQQLAKELTQYPGKIRLVARNPQRINADDELVVADLLNPAQTQRAVAGSSVAYLTVGLPYITKYWEQNWPQLMKNVIQACAAEGVKLVFFDNIYMYDANALDGMDENTPIRPSTRKGKVRQAVAEMVLAAHRAGKIEALIARSADFYGPGIENGVLNDLVVKNLQAGKRPQWLLDADQPHNFTFTPDAARATAQLGNDPSAYGRVWHVPTITTAPTGREWIAHLAKAAGVPAKSPMIIKPFMLKAMGLVMPIMASLHEMVYQYDRPYRFLSHAFTARYGWEATPLEEGCKVVMKG